MHIHAQSGRFDHPSRQFASVATAYELSTTSIGDYREIIPEFFFDGCFLMNHNGFNLGTARGEPLNHVELPPWCKTAMEFVYLNRKALESDHVSERIRHWIDLIWGYKQSGKEAAAADNLFYPYLYEAVWQTGLRPELKGDVTAALDCCGQIPQQLFLEPHPVRAPIDRTIVLQNRVFLPGERRRLHGLFGNCLVCSDRDTIYTTMVSLKAHKVSARDKHEWTAKAALRAASPLLETSLIGLLESGDLCYTNAERSAVRVLPWDHGNVACFAASRAHIIVGGSDTSITLYHATHAFEIVASFPSFRTAIACCAISARFDLAVVGARDSTVFLISLSRKTITSVLALENCNPDAIVITEGWGFIVLCESEIATGNRFVELMTVNGETIRKVPIDFEIRAWSSWKSSAGFDYLIVSPGSGKLRWCEVFYLDFNLIDEPGTAESIFYAPQFRVIFAGQSDGRIEVIPFGGPD
jgi:hypothetical protein